jgi:hypothetical protein
MSSREFIDAAGRVWRVRSTVPSGTGLLAADYADGWLTFETVDRVRRLAPIPDDWRSLRAEQLEYLCLCATEMPRRTGPMTRLERPTQPGAPPP